MSGSPTFKPVQNDLITSGNTGLIKNANLNGLLTTWPSDAVGLKEIEYNWEKIMWGSFVPLCTNIGILRDGLHVWWKDEQNLNWILEEGLL